MDYHQHPQSQRPPRPYHDNQQPRQRGPPQRPQQGHQGRHPDHHGGQAYGDQYGGGAAYGRNQRGQDSQGWDQAYDGGYNEYSGNAGGGYDGQDQGGYHPPPAARTPPTGGPPVQHGNGYGDNYSGRQGNDYLAAGDARRPPKQQRLPQQGYGPTLGRPSHHDRGPPAINGRRSEETSRTAWNDHAQWDNAYDADHTDRSARSFDEPRGDQRGPDGGLRPNTREQRQLPYGPPEKMRMPKSTTSPELRSWDNPFPTFPNIKKKSRQVEPEALEENMSKMRMEDDERQMGSREDRPASKGRPSGEDRRPNYRQYPSDSAQSQSSQRSPHHGPPADREYPFPGPERAPETQHHDQGYGYGRRQELSAADHDPAYGRPRPKPAIREGPRSPDGVHQARTAPSSPMKSSFENPGQRSMTMPNEVDPAGISDAPRQYPGQRQYKPSPLDQTTGPSPGGFDYEQQPSSKQSRSRPDPRERKGDGRMRNGPAPNGHGSAAQPTAPKASRQESMGDFYDSYYDSSNGPQPGPDPRYEDETQRGIDMPDFNAMPPVQPWGHQRGMTIDQHLKAPKGRPAPPPMPTQRPQWQNAGNQGSYQASAAALRSKSQPDLRAGASPAQRAPQYGEAEGSFEMVGSTPGHFELPNHSSAGDPRAYQNGGQKTANYLEDSYGQNYGQGPGVNGGDRDRISPNRRGPSPKTIGSRQSPPKGQRSPPGPPAMNGPNNPRPMPQRVGTNPPNVQGADARRANSLGNTSQSPDALPRHPPPIRPGLLPDSPANQPSRPPPVRQYNNSAPPSRAAVAPPPPEPSEPSERRNSVPITHDELRRLQEAVKNNPADQAMQLFLVKKLVEAASVLADEGGRADQKTRNKNRERYIFDAHRLLKKLVGYNYTEATFYLADCYGTGRLGLENDPKEAFVLYQSAAKAGHAEAAYRTAVCCELGQEGGTRKDPMKAIQWYKRAATLGNAQAMYKMGMIMLKGLMGQQKNPREAVSWLKRAAERADAQNPHALHELALLYENASGNDSIVRDEQYSKELYMRAADLGYKSSQFRLGCAFEYGLLGCPIDPRQSIAWYSKAAVQEEHQSELALSGWYLTGSETVLQQSDTEAYLWARKAAQAGLAKAEYAMGYFTEVGIGAPANLEDAKRWYWRASAQNFPKAKERLEDLRRGGAKMQKSRERLSRSNVHRNESDCVLM